MCSKSFREVISDIKEGEVWESFAYTITKKGDGISIVRKDGFVPNGPMFFSDNSIYKLQRKEYTFEEAFKAYEEGKEIESCKYKYKKIKEKDMCYLKEGKRWIEGYPAFKLEEIRGKWYINETM